MGEYILSIDLGTTSTKVALINRVGRVIGAGNADYETYYSRSNWAEQDPNDWWRAICKITPEVLQKCTVSPGEIACIVFSAKTLGLIPVDAEGKPDQKS